MDTLFPLKFYSNFQKIIDVNSDHKKQTEVSARLKLIENYICKKLSIDKLQECNLETVRKLEDPCSAENILKYLIDFRKITISEKDIKTNDPKFLHLYGLVIRKDDKQFGRSFGDYQKTKEAEFPEVAHLSEVLVADFNILIQCAYLHNYKLAIKNIIKCKKIDVNCLKIRCKKNKYFAVYAAEKGYSDLLKLFFDSKNKKLNLVVKMKDDRHQSILTECLKGSSYFKNEEIKSEDFYPRKYDDCIDLIVKQEEFPETILPLNPMRDIVKHHNEYAALKLINIFGLLPQFVQELNRSFLESFLDSKVTESQNSVKDFNIKADYEFLMKKENSPDSSLDSLAMLTSHNELKDLITHPVLSSFVEMKLRRFKYLYIVNLFLFITIFFGAIFCGHCYLRSLPFIIAGCYLLFRELLQLYFFLKNSKVLKSEEDLCNNCWEFLKSKGNMLEIALIWASFMTGFMLMNQSDSLLYYRIFITIIIILGSIEFSLLLIEVFPGLAIYIHMLKTVMITFIKISFLVVIYIMAFGFCFHVIFYSPMADTEESSEINETLNTESENTVENSDPKKDKRFGTFESLWIGFIKTIIMLTGEYEASDLNFWGWSGYALLLCFVLTSILIYNFINGLAIADVQKLKEKGEFLDLKLKILTIQRHERYLEDSFDQNTCFLKRAIIGLIVSEPFVVTSGIVNEKRVVQFQTNVESEEKKDKIKKDKDPSHKIIKIPTVTLSKDSYDRLKDILNGKESNEESKSFEKKFDSLTFEFSQMKENLSETLNTNFEKINEEVNSKLENFTQEFKNRNEKFNSHFKSVEEQVEIMFNEMNVMKNDISDIKNLLKLLVSGSTESDDKQSEFAANESNALLQEKRSRFRKHHDWS